MEKWTIRRIGSINSNEDLRLPAQLRLKFEGELETLFKGKSVRMKFKDLFSKDLDTYCGHIEKSIKHVFEQSKGRKWFCDQNIDIVTWHYKTRHSTFEAAQESPWFSGQVIFKSKLKGHSELQPYPGIKSPYIDIFSNEENREKRGMGGPIAILLPENELVIPPEIVKDWNGIALIVPKNVTEVLRNNRLFPEHRGDKDPLDVKHLNILKRKNPAFVEELGIWMNKVCGKNIDEVKAINNLLASLKVTLKLLRDNKYRCKLPRSTFLCPAYVAGEEVGGMAFACDKFVSRKTAIIGETTSRDIFSYLRLREDALAHNIVEEKEMLDQVKRFFVHRLLHDFRHPVDALQSTIKDLLSSLRTIDEQINHVVDVMDDTILTMEGRDPEEVLKTKKSLDNVSEFLADVLYFFKRQFEQKHKRIILTKINPHWTFNIDRGLLHEVMENLISNALEHGGPNVRIEVNRKRGSYLIHIQDDGKGIPVNIRENIFRPFYGRSFYTEGTRSRGRGLAISRMLVEAHKGVLRLEQGKGRWRTDFVVEIPEK